MSHRRTVHFRPLLEFMFFVGDQILPADTPVERFRCATQFVLTLDKQKNVI